MKRGLVLALLLFASPAEAQFRTATDWAALPAPSRTAYMAGARDTLALLAMSGQGALLKKIDACLQDSRYGNATWLADSVAAYVKSRADLANANSAEVAFSYIENLCATTPTRRDVDPAEAVISLSEFTAFAAPLRASYIEAVQDSLHPIARDKKSKVARDLECMKRDGLADPAKLAEAALKYAGEQEGKINKDASFAQITLVFLGQNCK
jgi:hypothetical protein